MSLLPLCSRINVTNLFRIIRQQPPSTLSHPCDLVCAVVVSAASALLVHRVSAPTPYNHLLEESHTQALINVTCLLRRGFKFMPRHLIISILPLPMIFLTPKSPHRLFSLSYRLPPLSYCLSIVLSLSYGYGFSAALLSMGCGSPSYSSLQLSQRKSAQAPRRSRVADRSRSGARSSGKSFGAIFATVRCYTHHHPRDQQSFSRNHCTSCAFCFCYTSIRTSHLVL